MTSLETLHSLKDNEINNINNWYGPYKLFYYSTKDSRPFVPSRQKLFGKYLSKNNTINFANMEGNLWLVSILTLSIYPLIRGKYYKKDQNIVLDKKYRMKKQNWYGLGPFFRNRFYYCMDDTRAFVKSNVDVFERGNRSKIWLWLIQKNHTLNFANLEAKLWLCTLFGLAFYPLLRMKMYA